MAKVELQLPNTDGLRSFLTPVLFLIAAVGALAIDMPVAQFSKNVSCPRLVVELLDRAEPFGHFFGAVMALTAVVLLDPAMRGRIGWAIGATLGGGLLANLIKLLVLRSRPRASNLIDGTVWDTFGGWFQRDLNSRSQSFPSGHTATAVGLAVVLAAWAVAVCHDRRPRRPAPHPAPGSLPERRFHGSGRRLVRCGLLSSR